MKGSCLILRKRAKWYSYFRPVYVPALYVTFKLKICYLIYLLLIIHYIHLSLGIIILYVYARCMTLRVKLRSHTSHVVQSVRAPVPPYDGGEDVIKGVTVFGGNQPISEQPPGFVCYHLQNTVCHIRLSYKTKPYAQIWINSVRYNKTVYCLSLQIRLDFPICFWSNSRHNIQPQGELMK